MQIWVVVMSLYVPHMNSPPVTMLLGMLYTENTADDANINKTL